MEDKATYQIAGRINREEVQKRFRMQQILEASLKHFGVTYYVPNDAFKEAIYFAMSRFKTDDYPRLKQQLADQEIYIKKLEETKANLPEWRYKEKMECAIKIKERIENDIANIDHIEIPVVDPPLDF